MANPLRSIKGRLLIFGLCISLIPIAIITTIYYLSARSVVKKQTLDWLTAVAESKEVHVLEFMNGRKGRATDFASDRFIRNSLEKINRGESLEHDTAIALNRYLLQHKKPLDPSIEGIEIVNLEGMVVISDREANIGRNIPEIERLTPGENLAYMRVIDKNYTETRMGSPHHSKLLNMDSVCAAAPITSMENGEPLGVLINHYNLKLLNEIATNREGMGETGEVYLVNSDGLMITESRFIEDALFKQVVDTEPVRRIAESGEEMTGVYPDYRGVPIVGASMYLPEYGWTLLAEIDKAEAFAPLKRLGLIAMILGLVSAAAVIAIGIIFAVSASRPIRRLTDATRRFAGGDLKSRVKITRRDEVGELADSFNVMARGLEEEITEHKKTEDKLTEHAMKLAKANTRLKELDQLKSMFIASMSHELRTPLNSIIGFTGVLLQGMVGEISEKQKDHLNRVNRSAKHLLGLINDIIDISRVEAGKVEVFIEEFTLDDVIKEAVESVQPQIKEKGLTLEVSIPPGVLLKTDRKRLLQCILNYLSNAVKFTEAGTVSIAAREIDGEVEISVSDTGIGISEQDQAKLFKPFVRLDSHLRTRTLGTGLGLYLTQKLTTEVLGGTVAAQSQPGKGSTFTLRLPKERRRKKA
ncbi:MAG: sensor histidine kinase [Candidatus Brocadiales bacterium]|nr:sensor histidine kinase [Candidatus Bathyanammoxibius amoris]